MRADVTVAPTFVEEVNYTHEQMLSCFRQNGHMRAFTNTLRARVSLTPTEEASGNLTSTVCTISFSTTAEKRLKIDLKMNADIDCISDNYVWVSDRNRKWIPHCSPSRSRYKDCSVSSSGHNVTLKIYVGDPPALTIGILLFAMEQGLKVVRLSPTHGYIIPPGFDAGVHYLNNLDVWSQIHPPSDHVTFLSMRRLELDTCCDKVELYAGGTTEGERVWKLGRFVPPLPVLLNMSNIHVHFKSDRYTENLGFQLVFSYHLSQPSRVSNGLWNCSGPEWVGFQRHFLCNLAKECDGGEDEVPCHYTGHCGDGHLTLENRCYTYVRAAKGTRKSWRDSNLDCQARGGYTVSLNTPGEWQAVTAIFSVLTPVFRVFLGLHPTTSTLPRMYFSSFMWADRTMAYYINVEDIEDNMCWYVFRVLEDIEYGWIHCDSEENFDVLCEFDFTSAGSLEENAGKDTAPVRIPVPLNISLPVPSVKCPRGHLSHAFLACDEQSSCWLGRRGYEDGGRARQVPSEVTCPASSLTSLPAMFACSSAGSQRVPYSVVCDHREQCADGSDESFCVFPACSGSTPLQCAGLSQCIALSDLCDGQGDCLHDTDEIQCDIDFANELATLPPPAIVYFTPVTSETEYQGPFDTESLPQSSPLADEPCPETHFQCAANGYCLPVFLRCNGVNDCPGREDEAGCSSSSDVSCPGFYRCRSSSVCLHSSHVCDGAYQCPEQDDERFCRLTCPEGCACHGLAFTCPQFFRADLQSEIRYLDASGSGLTPAHLGRSGLLIHLGLSRCGLESLANMSFPNLRSLDLSDNKLAVVTVDHFRELRNLQFLSLSRNPLRSLFSRRHTGEPLFTVLRTLDVSGGRIPKLDTRSLSHFPGLQTLNLSNCGVDFVSGGNLYWTKNLQVLDTAGCPMTQFPRDLISVLDRLQSVRADNFKLCCPETLPAGFNPANCRAPFNEISSCESLLRSDVYRIFIALFSGLSLVGNCACFLVRSALSKSTSSGFSVFVTHLSISDFLMGVYLGVIGVADRVYRGSYLWEDTAWRHSAACTTAGFLSLTSNEVSAFIISLITLDRFIVLRFPFSDFRFRPKSAHVTCVLVWVTASAVASVPLTSMTSHWSFYSQTGICIPLPVNRGDFAGRYYAFGILIVFNFILFLLIAVGQASIYISVRASSLSEAETTKKSNDLRIARRLITVAMSDFLCWFPIGLLGLLASRGVPIPGEVNVGMAVLVLPLNSALNPFLYTVNVVLERRRKSREEQLLKQLIGQTCKEE